MKKYSFILKIVISLMLVTIAVLGAKKAGAFDSHTVGKSQTDVSESSPASDETSLPDDSEADGSEVSDTDSSVNDSASQYQTDLRSMMKNVTYDIGETCETEEWQYYLKSVDVTKSSEGMDLFLEGYYTEDENGNLICDSSFIIADIEVTNNASSDRQLYMNSTRVDLYSFLGNSQYDCDNSIEACAYVFNGERSIYTKSYFATDFKAGETKSFRIGYIIHDEYLDKDFDLIRIEINHSGMADFNENLRYYRIGENTSLKELFEDA